MPTLFNHDHQAVVVDHELPAVLPGESHEFTDEQVEAGIAGNWKTTAPRGKAGKALKETREEFEQTTPPAKASEEAKPDAVDRRS